MMVNELNPALTLALGNQKSVDYRGEIFRNLVEAQPLPSGVI